MRFTNNIDTSRFGYYDVRPLLFVSLYRVELFSKKKEEKTASKMLTLTRVVTKNVQTIPGDEMRRQGWPLEAFPLIIFLFF